MMPLNIIIGYIRKIVKIYNLKLQVVDKFYDFVFCEDIIARFAPCDRRKSSTFATLCILHHGVQKCINTLFFGPVRRKLVRIR